MKKTGIFSILLALVLMLAVPFNASAAAFNDVKGDFWASYEINRLVSKGLIKGYEDNTFRPQENVTRAQAAVTLARVLNLDTTQESKIEYEDVSKDYYAYKEIAAVTNADIMQGSEGKFNPDEALTRAQMATILAKAFDLKGNGTAAFADVAKDHYAYEAIDALYANKITTGTEQNTYNPEQPTTRAHFVAFISRVLDNQYANDPIVEELKEIYNNEFNLNSYEFEGTMNFGFEFPQIEGLTEEDMAIFDMFENINVDFTGVYQKEPLQLEMNMTVKLEGPLGFTATMPVVMTDEKMWFQIPELPFAPTPEEFKGKYIEMDFAELSEFAGEPAPVMDINLQQKLNEALYDVFFKHFGGEFYEEVSKDAVQVPAGAEVEKVIKFEVTKEELAPFVQKLFNQFLPEFFTLLENPEYAKAVGLTQEDIRLVKEGLSEASVEINAVVGEINQFVTLNAFNEYIAVHPDKYIVYDVLNFDIDVTMEGETLGLKLGYKIGKSNVNEAPNFVIGIPNEADVIKFQDLMIFDVEITEEDLVLEEEIVVEEVVEEVTEETTEESTEEAVQETQEEQESTETTEEAAKEQ